MGRKRQRVRDRKEENKENTQLWEQGLHSARDHPRNPLNDFQNHPLERQEVGVLVRIPSVKDHLEEC